ncbi:MAG: hypothetical protein J7L07_07065 [Candidatus Odinarchaeota archaeon]|nr:hypothetical protein [Candidatus Odinarchaeota archaeon]
MSIVNQIKDILEEEILKCREYLGIRRELDISTIKIAIGAAEKPDDNILVIPELFLQDDDLLRAAIRFFVFKLFMPPNLKDVEESDDLAMLYAYIGVENNEEVRKLWIELWKAKSPEKTFCGKFVYRPVKGFIDFNVVSNGKFLSEIMSLFWRLNRYREKIDFEKYALILEEYMTTYATKFSDTDKLILEYILRFQPSKSSQIAKALKIKEATLSNHINSLRRRYILIWKDTINFWLIGLSTYLVFFESGGNWSEIIGVLKKHPYFCNAHEIPYGPNPALLVFLGPHTNTYYSILDRFASKLSKQLGSVSYRIMRIDGFDVRYINVRLYDNRNGRWNIPWYSWGVFLKRIMEEGPVDNLHTLSKVSPQVIKNLDEKDLEILEYVWDKKEISFIDLRKKLRIGANRLSEKLKFFRENKVIVRRASAGMLGLVESALIVGDFDEDEALRLASALNELPRVTTSWSRSSECIASLINLPPGGSRGFLNAIKLFYPSLFDKRIYVGDLAYGVYWKFRKDLFDIEKQSWKHLEIEI